VIIDVPRGLVDVRLEVPDVCALNPDLGTAQRDQSIHLVLFGSKVVNHTAKALVQLVEFLQLVVHIQRLLFKNPDVFLEGRYVFFKFFDFVVKHEFELVQLLGLFLEAEDFALAISNLPVFLTDHSLLLL
jgi:hypothetical protein